MIKSSVHFKASVYIRQELDDSTGLYDYGARQYDAKLARFISADTVDPKLENPQSLNRYSYCLNNPLKYVDPTGNEPITAALYAYVVALISSPDFQQDLQQLALDAQTGDIVGMAIDVLSVAIPGLSATAARAGSKAISGAVEAAGKTRILNKVGKLGNVISKATRKAIEAGKKQITVIGSLQDTAKFKGKKGFNVLEEVLEKQGKEYSEALNKTWLDESIARGDEIWAVTNPKKHRALAKEKGFTSEFIKTEIPHLKKKTGVSVLDKFK